MYVGRSALAPPTMPSQENGRCPSNILSATMFHVGITSAPNSGAGANSVSDNTQRISAWTATMTQTTAIAAHTVTAPLPAGRSDGAATPDGRLPALTATTVGSLVMAQTTATLSIMRRK